MTASPKTLKQKILLEIEKLPEHKLLEVLDFVGFLLVKENAQSSLLQNQTHSNSFPHPHV